MASRVHREVQARFWEGSAQTCRRNAARRRFPTLHNRLDLSVEAHALKPEYAELFSDEERKLCRDRLKEFDYPVD